MQCNSIIRVGHVNTDTLMTLKLAEISTRGHNLRFPKVQLAAAQIGSGT